MHMLLTVHALTGITLGSYIEDKLVLAPISFGSHFALDSLPHFGLKGLDFRTPKGFIIGSLDFAGALSVLAIGLLVAPDRSTNTIIGWLGATLPDLFYLPEVFFNIVVFPSLKAFHHRIQWAETLPGTVVDIVWGTLMAWLFFHRL